MSVFSDEPDPAGYYEAVEVHDCVRYTDPSEQQWFIDRIEFTFGGTANARVEGDVIRWFSAYELHLGDWLYEGQQPVSHDQLHRARILPHGGGDWPDPPTSA